MEIDSGILNIIGIIYSGLALATSLCASLYFGAVLKVSGLLLLRAMKSSWHILASSAA